MMKPLHHRTRETVNTAEGVVVATCLSPYCCSHRTPPPPRAYGTAQKRRLNGLPPLRLRYATGGGA